MQVGTASLWRRCPPPMRSTRTAKTRARRLLSEIACCAQALPACRRACARLPQTANLPRTALPPLGCVRLSGAWQPSPTRAAQLRPSPYRRGCRARPQRLWRICSAIPSSTNCAAQASAARTAATTKSPDACCGKAFPMKWNNQFRSLRSTSLIRLRGAGLKITRSTRPGALVRVVVRGRNAHRTTTHGDRPSSAHPLLLGLAPNTIAAGRPELESEAPPGG